MAIEGQIF